MLFGLLLTVHILVCLFLIIVVMLQGGRGGLSETLGGGAAQTLFGGGTNVVMAKITTATALMFAVTCLSLAAMSSAKGRSVIEELPAAMPEIFNPPAELPIPAPAGEAPSPPAPVAPPSAETPAPPTP